MLLVVIDATKQKICQCSWFIICGNGNALLCATTALAATMKKVTKKVKQTKNDKVNCQHV